MPYDDDRGITLPDENPTEERYVVAWSPETRNPGTENRTS
jgi:hypothetical protein